MTARPKPLARPSSFSGLSFGPASAVAVEAAKLTAATAERSARYTPIFLHGPSDADKAGLARALARELREAAVDFLHVDGAAADSPAAEALIACGAGKGRRSPRVVIVTRFHRLGSSPRTRKICDALAALARRRRHVVILSDLPPQRVPGLGLPRTFLQALASGLVLRLDPAEGAAALAVDAPRRSGASRATVSHDAVLDAVAACFSVPVPALTGPGRQAEVVLARHAGMYLFQADAHLSLPAIGDIFGDRDHSTVLHGVRRIEDMLSGGDFGLLQRIEAVRRRLGTTAPGRECEAAARAAMPAGPDAATVLTETAAVFCVPVHALVGRTGKNSDILQARHAAIYAMCTDARHPSASEVGRMFGDLTLQAVRYAVKRVEERLDRGDFRLLERIEALRSRIGAVALARSCETTAKEAGAGAAKAAATPYPVVADPDAALLEGVAASFGLAASDLIGRSRLAETSLARHVAMYLMYTDRRQHLSLPAIGRMFGRRDHTTVLHGVNRIEGMIVRGDRRLLARIQELRRRFGIVGDAA